MKGWSIQFVKNNHGRKRWIGCFLALCVWHRNGKYQGLEQVVGLADGLKPSTNYYLSGRIKLVDPPFANHRLELFVRITGG